MEGGFAVGLVAIGHEQTAAVAESIAASTLTFAANWIVAVPAWIGLLVSGALRKPSSGGS